jgi:hypothetical protein
MVGAYCVECGGRSSPSIVAELYAQEGCRALEGQVSCYCRFDWTVMAELPRVAWKYAQSRGAVPAAKPDVEVE